MKTSTNSGLTDWTYNEKERDYAINIKDANFVLKLFSTNLFTKSSK